jgi:hypothetical protein
MLNKIRPIKRQKIYQSLESIPIIKRVIEKARRVKSGLKLVGWVENGMEPPPPPIVSRERILKEARKEGIDIFVETGTLFGRTLKYVCEDFKTIYSIEVKKELYIFNKEKIGREKNINIIHGDSKYELVSILKEIEERALFWLDAHCSEGITGVGESYTPIMDEIEIILNHHKKHVMLIDDLRLFKEDKKYPKTDDIKNLVGDRMFEHDKEDMIIIR